MHTDWVVLLVAASAFGLGALAAPRLIRLNLTLYRRLHLQRLAAFWQERFDRWVPAVRGICLAGAAACAALALLR